MATKLPRSILLPPPTQAPLPTTTFRLITLQRSLKRKLLLFPKVPARLKPRTLCQQECARKPSQTPMKQSLFHQQPFLLNSHRRQHLHPHLYHHRHQLYLHYHQQFYHYQHHLYCLHQQHHHFYHHHRHHHHLPVSYHHLHSLPLRSHQRRLQKILNSTQFYPTKLSTTAGRGSHLWLLTQRG